MRSRLLSVVCLVFFFFGCQRTDSLLNEAIALRNNVLNSDGCSFQTKITADYGDRLYVFTMDCKTDRAGDLTFVVQEPETIAGITGNISGTGGRDGR